MELDGLTMKRSTPIDIKLGETKSSIIIEEEFDEDLSYSVLVDNHSKPKLRTESIVGTTPPERDFIQTNLNKIYPKETKKWVNSSLILQCQSCHREFNILYRKHHCRTCGRVFCYSCCNHYVDIPEGFIHIPEEDSSYAHWITKTKRQLFNLDSNFVCTECYTKITNINNTVSIIETRDKSIKLELEHIIKICEFLDLESLFNISSVSRGWHNVSIHYLSKFRAIQYKNPLCLYNEWETNIIWNSKEYYTEHSCLILCLIKSSLQKYYLTRNPDLINPDMFYDESDKDHIQLMCSRRCNIELDIIDLVEILKFVLMLEITTKLFWSDMELKKFISYIVTGMVNIRSLELVQFLTPIICDIFIELMKYPLTLNI